MNDTAPRIDLNSDLGEGYGPWSFDTDSELVAIVTSANIACGFHAGDPTVIRRAIGMAAQNGVTIGAHVSYPDLQGFGRRDMCLPRSELTDLIVYQLATLEGLCRVAGTEFCYVKPHGALYNRIIHDAEEADTVAGAIAEFDPRLAVLALPGSQIHAAAARRGVPLLREAFADRAYLASGQLAPRSLPGSVLHDPALVAARVLRMVQEHAVEAIDGTPIAVHADSICVHGDSDGAVQMAQRIRRELLAAGITVTGAARPASRCTPAQ